MKENPYLIPTDGKRRVIHFSGGRTSGFMLWHILEAHGGTLPQNVKVAFCNTGQEHGQTLAFVDRFEKETRVPILWLEFAFNPNAKGGRKDPKTLVKKVSLRTANYTGRPFRAMIKAAGILPNQSMRKCTSELKVGTVNRYLFRKFGWYSTSFISVLGIRHDEKHRTKKAIWEECRVEYPLVHAKITERDILEFWNRQDFDLGIPGRKGNCDLCFLKGKGNLIRLIREDPASADWWIEMEDSIRPKARKRKLIKSEMAQFSKRHSYRQLKHLALSAPELPFEEEDEPAVSCFCGD